MTLAMLLVLINHHKGLTILLIVIIALLFMALKMCIRDRLEAIQAQWLRRAKTQQLVATENVLSGEVITEGKIRTLAQLFALEYQQLMQEND